MSPPGLRARGHIGARQVLVSAGEASGDLMAAGVVRRLAVQAFGLGGEHLRRCGMEILADARSVAVMGFVSPLHRAARLAHAYGALLAAARRRRPAAALLVGFSEFNARLGPALRGLGVRVLWYSPPQIWAWRRHRAPRLAKSCDRMALILPFEEAIWRPHGADAEFVGHPALEDVEARDDGEDRAPGSVIGLLPGSREQEVRRHWPVLREAAALLRPRAPAEVRIAGGLPAPVARQVQAEARRDGIEVAHGTGRGALGRYRLSLVASGTATAECAVQGVPPVVLYRTDPLTYAIARRLVHVRDIGLPNLVLGRRVFPELVQHALSGPAVAAAATHVLDHPEDYARYCRAVRDRLTPPSGRPPSERVAEMLDA